MTDRARHPYEDDSGHLRDMTEETLGAQEQERQERQHQQDQQRGRRTDDESARPEREDNEYYL